MLKKLLREIDRLEQSKTKKVEQIKMLQDEVNKIDEELKPYYTLKKQYDKLESTANQLFENNWCYLERIKAIAEYTNSFDEEEHIKMWLNAKDIDNNRLNVPSITELVEDAKNIKQMLTELSEGLESEPELDKEDFEPDICDGY